MTDSEGILGLNIYAYLNLKPVALPRVAMGLSAVRDCGIS